MDFIFEIILLVIIIGGSYLGIKYGFVKIVAKPMKTLFCFAFAFSVSSGVGRAVVAPMIQVPVTNYVKDFMYQNYSNLSVDNAMAEIPTVLKIAGAVFNVDKDMTVAVSTDSLLESVIFNLTSPVVEILAIIIAFVLMFLFARVLFGAGMVVINSAFDGRILGGINKICGMVLAALIALVTAWAFVGLSDFLLQTPALHQSDFARNFSGGPIYRFFSGLNLLKLILSF